MRSKNGKRSSENRSLGKERGDEQCRGVDIFGAGVSGGDGRNFIPTPSGGGAEDRGDSGLAYRPYMEGASMDPDLIILTGLIDFLPIPIQNRRSRTK
jgi:hypothetical protein